MNYVRSNNLCLKYLRFRPSGCKDISIRKLTAWKILKSFIQINIVFDVDEPVDEDIAGDIDVSPDSSPAVKCLTIR